jgi:hypothetical protein
MAAGPSRYTEILRRGVCPVWRFRKTPVDSIKYPANLFPFEKLCSRRGLGQGSVMSATSIVNEAGEDTTAERAAVHRLVATVEELMRALMAKGVLTRDELNAIEACVADRIGEVARIW